MSPCRYFRIPGLVVSLLILAGQGRAGETAWRSYHGGAGLRGLAAAEVPDAPRLIWRFRTGAPVSATPVSDGKLIYVTTESADLVALDIAGNVQWRTRLLGDPGLNGEARPEFLAPPVVVDGKVVVAADSGRVRAFDGRGGEPLWLYEAGDPVQGAPTWCRTAGGELRILVLTQPEGILHALDGEGELQWRTKGIARSDGTPAAGQGRVVFGSCNAAIHVYDTLQGKAAGDIELGEGCEIAGGMALVDGRVFTGSRSGSLVCVDLASGRTLWSHDTDGGELFSTPAVGTRFVVAASGDGRVLCLERETGKAIWVTAPDAQDVSSPVIAGNRVVVCMDGVIRLLDLASGSRIWQFEAGDDVTSPAVFDGRIVVGTGSGTVMVFGRSRKEDKE